MTPVADSTLLRNLDRSSSLEHLTTLVRRVAADTAAWQPRLRLPEGTERWWTLLFADEHADVWLQSWRPGHTTDLHDHGTSAAAFTVVRGLLDEIRVDDRGRPTSLARRPGSVIWLAPGVVHDVRGGGAGPAVSIHGYAPPLTHMNYFAPDGREGLRVVRTVATFEPEQDASR